MATPSSQRLAGLVVLLVVSACGGEGQDGMLFAQVQLQALGVSIVVTPRAPLLPAGASVQLTATVTGSSDARVTWSVGQGGGTITAAGLYTAPQLPGTYQVTATSLASPGASATVVVDVRQRVAGHSVTVEPALATVNPGGTVGFSALVDGTVDSRVTWSLLSSGGGNISPQGTYTAPSSPGQYTVAAVIDAYPGEVGTATVTVVPGATVVVSPAEDFVAPGGTLTLSGVAVGPVDPRVSWSVDEGATGGSVDASGAYRAPQAGGPYHVTATSRASPGAKATATLWLRSLAVEPASTQAFVGDTVYLTATSNDPSVTYLTWTLDGANFASLPISESVRVYLTSLGEHTVTASAGGTSASARVTALDRPGFHVSGTASGLSSSVRLQLRSGDLLVNDSVLLSSDGSFTFPNAVKQGIQFTVAVLANANTSPCTLANASGLMPGADFSGVRLDCGPPAEIAGNPGIVDRVGRLLVQTVQTTPVSQATFFGLARLNADTLTPDAGFGAAQWTAAAPIWSSTAFGTNVAQDSAGRYLVAGADWVGKHFSLLRLTPQGAPDQTFGTNGVATIDWFGLPMASTGAFMSFAYTVLVLPDGRILAAGGAARGWDGSLPVGVAACFLPDGSLDATFGNGGTVLLPLPEGVTDGAIASALARLPDGRIAISQHERSLMTWHPSADQRGIPAQVHWMSDSGALDPAFTRLVDPSGKVVVEGVESMLARGDGSLWLTGSSSSGLLNLTHVLADATIDGDSPRAVPFGGACTSGAGQPPSLLGGATGAFYDWSPCGLHRWNEDGSLDTTFGLSGVMTLVNGSASGANVVYGYWLLPSGAIVASGRFNGFFLKQIYP